MKVRSGWFGNTHINPYDDLDSVHTTDALSQGNQAGSQYSYSTNSKSTLI